MPQSPHLPALPRRLPASLHRCCSNSPSLHALLLDRADAGSRLETGCSDASRCLLLLQICTLFPAGSTCFPFSGCLAAAAAAACLPLSDSAGWRAGGLDGGCSAERPCLVLSRCYCSTALLFQLSLSRSPKSASTW